MRTEIKFYKTMICTARFVSDPLGQAPKAAHVAGGTTHEIAGTTDFVP